MLIKQNTAKGITIVCDKVAAPTAPNNYSVSKAGAGQVGPGGTFTSEQPGIGWWLCHVALAAGDTDTLGDLLVVAVDGGGSVIGKLSCQVVSYDPEDGARDLTHAAQQAMANVLLDVANGVESGITVRQGLRVVLAALAGKLSISGPNFVFRNTPDNKNRITAICDNQGQRLSITLDLT